MFHLFHRLPGSMSQRVTAATLSLLAGMSSLQAAASGRCAEVAALDIAYQAAVERNDADAMGRILADDFVLVVGSGKAYSRADLLDSARAKHNVFEIQAEDPGTQTVRCWNDTAVVTALLRLKGTSAEGVAFDYKVWFSDTYVRLPGGWRYVFGQAGQRL